MWLLSTNRAELHFFSGPEDSAIMGGYAILSHTWGNLKDEQTFQETQALYERCKETGDNPRDLATPKVRESCMLAERRGYRWIWNDTCCIDKTSSTELSEAIKSMFRWYSLAEVCFAYLADVESDCVLDAPGSAFSTARWHSRGWTLQELIAPSFVVFVSRDWKIIGNKTELASLLEGITGVWKKVLTREVHYSTLSVARRMLWAAGRSTKRVEDEAYCLMGLFDINMPTIYGEGRHAFQRLQHELMKQSIDTSLFAWGRWIYSENAAPVKPHENRQIFNIPSGDDMYILARSPKNFNIRPFGRVVRYTPSAKSPVQSYPPEKTSKCDPEGRPLGPFGPAKLPRFSSTSYGLECHFPIIESDGLTVAVLLCDTGREHLGLLLHLSNDRVQDPFRKKYHTGYGFRRQPLGARYPRLEFARLVSLGDDFRNLRLNGKTVTAEWRDVWIVDRPPIVKRDVPPSLCSALHSIAPAPPFRIPYWLIIRLMSMGMELRPLRVESNPMGGKTFEDVYAKEGIRLILGTCSLGGGFPAHWAKAMPRCPANWSERPDYSHDCVEDHVDA
ncbi:HET-domain-containing protein [Ganoderma leucocontextum]|nr:HET-domain-containing protein [Ganoderma leucocontextum]